MPAGTRTQVRRKGARTQRPRRPYAASRALPACMSLTCSPLKLDPPPLDHSPAVWHADAHRRKRSRARAARARGRAAQARCKVLTRAYKAVARTQALFMSAAACARAAGGGGSARTFGGFRRVVTLQTCAEGLAEACRRPLSATCHRACEVSERWRRLHCMCAACALRRADVRRENGGA